MPLIGVEPIPSAFQANARHHESLRGIKTGLVIPPHDFLLRFQRTEEAILVCGSPGNRTLIDRLRADCSCR